MLAEGTLGELQERLGGDRVFVLEADFKDTSPDAWDGFHQRFRIIQKIGAATRRRGDRRAGSIRVPEGFARACPCVWRTSRSSGRA